MADLQQITENSFQVAQFMEKFGTILHPPNFLLKELKDLSHKLSLLNYWQEWVYLLPSDTVSAVFSLVYFGTAERFWRPREVGEMRSLASEASRKFLMAPNRLA